MSIITKLIIFIVIIICLFVSFGHIFSAIVQYFNYSTITATEYGFTGYNNRFPSVTLCGQKSQFITDVFYDRLIGGSPIRPIGEVDSDMISTNLAKMTVKEQFEAMLSAEDIRQSIECRFLVRDGIPLNNKTMDCNQIMDLRLSFDSDYYCFTLFSAMNRSQNGLNWKKSLYSSVRFEVRLKAPELLISLHSASEPMYDIMKSSPQAILLEPKRTTNVYYGTQTTILLSEPYGSCYSYQGGDLTRDGCLVKHRTSDSQNKNGCLPSNYLVYNSSLESFFCSDTVNQSETHEDSRTRYLYYYCRSDCHEVDYTLTSLKLVSGLSKPEAHTINVMPSKQMSKSIVSYPAMTIVDLNYQVLNVLCLWMAALALYLLSRIGLESKLTRIHHIK